MSSTPCVRSLLVLGLIALPLAACQEVGLVDNVDLTFDWAQLLGPSDSLHTPYVAGSSFDIWVTTAKKQSLRRWRMVSADEGVIELGEPVFSVDSESMFVPVRTKHAGQVELSVHDSADEVRHRRVLEVKQPDRIDVLAHGELLIGRETHAPTDQPKILGGGTATFLLRYFAGDERLNGNGAATVAAPDEAGARIERTFVFEDRDWLQLSPDASLQGTSVALVVGGQTVRTLPVAVVDESALTRIELLGQDERDARDEDWLVVLAQAFDSVDSPIYGVEYDFTTDGVSAIGTGDLYRYRVKESRAVMLEATHGQHSNGVVIHSGGGFVDSTNRLGCGFAPGASGNGAVAIVVLGILGILLRRRRAH